MRNKFLGISESGCHPIRKIHTALSGLRYAVIYDWAVAYKMALSVPLMVGAFAARAWVDFILVLTSLLRISATSTMEVTAT